MRVREEAEREARRLLGNNLVRLTVLGVRAVEAAVQRGGQVLDL